MAEEARFLRMDPQLRKANLVAATLTCLKKYGFVGTSIRKICAEAGVSVGLISHHYAGKDELVADAYLHITGQVMSLLREAVANAGKVPADNFRRSSRRRFPRACSTRSCSKPGWRSGVR